MSSLAQPLAVPFSAIPNPDNSKIMSGEGSGLNLSATMQQGIKTNLPPKEPFQIENPLTIPKAEAQSAPLAQASIPQQQPQPGDYAIHPGQDQRFTQLIEAGRQSNKPNQVMLDTIMAGNSNVSFVNFAKHQMATLQGSPEDNAKQILNFFAYGDPNHPDPVQPPQGFADHLDPQSLGLPTTVPGAYNYNEQTGGLPTIGQGLYNFLPSTVNLAKGAIGAAIHPLKTTEALARVAGGGLAEGYKAITGQDVPTGDQGDQQKSKDTFDAFVGNLKQRYGSIENFRKTMFEDPAGFLTDLATVAAPVSKGLEMAGVNTSDILGTAGKTADEVSTADSVDKIAQTSEETKPGFFEKKAQDQLDEYLKPTSKDIKYGRNPSKAVLDEGIIARNPEDLAQKASDLRDQVGQEIRPLVEKASQEDPVQIDLKPIIEKPIDQAMKKAMGTNSSPADPKFYAALKDLKDQLTKNYAEDENGNLVPIKSTAKGPSGDKSLIHTQLGAHDMQREVMGMIGWKGNPFDKEINQVLWKIGDGLRTQVNDNVPGISDLNERYSNLSALDTLLQRRLPALIRGSGHASKTRALMSGIGTTLATANPVAGFAAGAGEYGLEKFGNSALTRTAGAQAINSIPNLATKVGPALKTVSKAAAISSRIIPPSQNQ